MKDAGKLPDSAILARRYVDLFERGVAQMEFYMQEISRSTLWTISRIITTSDGLSFEIQVRRIDVRVTPRLGLLQTVRLSSFQTFNRKTCDNDKSKGELQSNILLVLEKYMDSDTPK